MTVIDPREAAEALNDIDRIVQRLRQSRIYHVASQIIIAAGVLVLAGNIATLLMPRQSASIWIAVNLLTIGIAVALGTISARQNRAPRFDLKIPAAFLMFYAFGIVCSSVLGRFGPRELGAFWPIYFMLFYCLAGLWFGRAFITIGLSIIVLTLIGYFYAQGAVFLVWMAVVNGGGLILGGLWMRRS